MFLAAMDDLDDPLDDACTYPELLELLPRAFSAPPAVRIAAWLAYMSRRRPAGLPEGLLSAAHPNWLNTNMLVDQARPPCLHSFLERIMDLLHPRSAAMY
jgi:hypothetical protein